jgi:hypothetical protein
MPHVSCNLKFFSRYGCNILYPNVDTQPAAQPTIQLPTPPISRLATQPIATPPANVAF